MEVQGKGEEHPNITQRPRRGLTEHPHRLHRGFTEDSQRTGRKLTEDSQRTYRTQRCGIECGEEKGANRRYVSSCEGWGSQDLDQWHLVEW